MFMKLRLPPAEISYHFIVDLTEHISMSGIELQAAVVLRTPEFVFFEHAVVFIGMRGICAACNKPKVQR